SAREIHPCSTCLVIAKAFPGTAPESDRCCPLWCRVKLQFPHKTVVLRHKTTAQSVCDSDHPTLQPQLLYGAAPLVFRAHHVETARYPRAKPIRPRRLHRQRLVAAISDFSELPARFCAVQL